MLKTDGVIWHTAISLDGFVFLQIAPVMIGAGVKIFADIGEPPVQLQLVHQSQSGQVVNLLDEPKQG